MLSLLGSLEHSRLRDDAPFVWRALQSAAFGAVTDERILIANRAAFSVVKIAKRIVDLDEAQLCAASLRRIAADPRVPVRSAIAHGGPDLADAKSEAVREAAAAGVLLVQSDDNAQVRRLLARARAVRAGAGTIEGKTDHLGNDEAAADGAP